MNEPELDPFKVSVVFSILVLLLALVLIGLLKTL